MTFNFGKYGYSRSNDPDYWVKTTHAIFSDPALTRDEQMDAVEDLVQEYYKEKRDKSAREAARAGKFPLGPLTKEQAEAELASLNRKKSLFKTAKDRARQKELEAFLSSQ